MGGVNPRRLQGAPCLSHKTQSSTGMKPRFGLRFTKPIHSLIVCLKLWSPIHVETTSDSKTKHRQCYQAPPCPCPPMPAPARPLLTVRQPLCPSHALPCTRPALHPPHPAPRPACLLLDPPATQAGMFSSLPPTQHPNLGSFLHSQPERPPCAMHQTIKTGTAQSSSGKIPTGADPGSVPRTRPNGGG